MNRAERVSRRLAAGSAAVYRRRADALAAWVAAGRREDLTGVRAALGPLVRLSVLALLVLGGYRALRAAPWLLWPAALVWVAVAWRAGRPAEAAEEPPAEEATGPTPAPSAEAAVALLREVLGGRPAVHLSTVLAHLQEHSQCEGWKVADLRVRLEALGIPVDPKVKVRGVPTRGVRAADLDAHFPTEETPPSPTQVDAA
ncbi:hypothetical protein [Streptomyces sp. CC208A]|uniref:hypothetical protein n=1 Tax=Streptomyces sp. CC208A TaxID=3044573 RepID=UPI0024A98B9D|nr:hypothetical protein [Streptomyces sp. CC208A]